MASGKLLGADMAARLRRKFVLVAEVSVAVVLVTLMGAVNIANYVNIRSDADELIELIAEYGGTIPTVFVGDIEVVVPDAATDGDGAEEPADGAEDGEDAGDVEAAGDADAAKDADAEGDSSTDTASADAADAGETTAGEDAGDAEAAEAEDAASNAASNAEDGAASEDAETADGSSAAAAEGADGSSADDSAADGASSSAADESSEEQGSSGSEEADRDSTASADDAGSSSSDASGSEEADGSAATSGDEADAASSGDAAADSDDASDDAAASDSDVILIDADTAFELFEEVHGRITAESTYDTRYFTVVVDAAGAAVTVDTSSIAAVTSDEAAQIAEELAAAAKTEGFYGGYRYQAVAYGTDADATDADADTDEGADAATASDAASSTGQTMYIFVDCTAELESFETLLTASLAMSAIGLVLVFILVVIFSYFVVAPIAESYEKQKRFITDASHEIKTPLSVIDAADEVVEIEFGESEWTQSIHDQVARLADLTNRLVFLSRMDEGADGFAMEELSLSQVVEQAAEPYAAVARARGKELTCEVEPGLTCKGDSKALSQVVELLLDNALQYSSEGSEVQLVARRHGRRCQIVVQNECDGLPEGDLDRLFERFYRADSSRSSETGGSGVGLSVVRAIAEAHKGTARAERVGEHAIRFVVEL